MRAMTRLLAMAAVLLIVIGAGFYLASLLLPRDNLKHDQIQVAFPQPNDQISSPMIIIGQARGGWYFEATFPVQLLDDKGFLLAQGYAESQSDWMTENFVPFKAVLNFEPGESKRGTLVLHRENPSGLERFEAELRIPVKF